MGRTKQRKDEQSLKPQFFTECCEPGEYKSLFLIGSGKYCPFLIGSFQFRDIMRWRVTCSDICIPLDNTNCMGSSCYSPGDSSKPLFSKPKTWWQNTSCMSQRFVSFPVEFQGTSVAMLLLWTLWLLAFCHT